MSSSMLVQLGAVVSAALEAAAEQAASGTSRSDGASPTTSENSSDASSSSSSTISTVHAVASVGPAVTSPTPICAVQTAIATGNGTTIVHKKATSIQLPLLLHQQPSGFRSESIIHHHSVIREQQPNGSVLNSENFQPGPGESRFSTWSPVSFSGMPRSTVLMKAPPKSHPKPEHHQQPRVPLEVVLQDHNYVAQPVIQSMSNTSNPVSVITPYVYSHSVRGNAGGAMDSPPFGSPPERFSPSGYAKSGSPRKNNQTEGKLGSPRKAGAPVSGSRRRKSNFKDKLKTDVDNDSFSKFDEQMYQQQPVMRNPIPVQERMDTSVYNPHSQDGPSMGTGEGIKRMKKEKKEKLKRMPRQNFKKLARTTLEPVQTSPEPEVVVRPPREERENTRSITSSSNNDQGITRCICDYLHDDGYMICCDKCYVWQHVDCMGIDRADIPDVYYCEQCEPRCVYKSRAKSIQLRKQEFLKRGLAFDISLMMSIPGGLNVFHDEDGSPKTAPPVEAINSPTKARPETISPEVKVKKRGRPSLSNGTLALGEAESDHPVVGPGRRRKSSGAMDKKVRILGKRRKSIDPNRVKRPYNRKIKLFGNKKTNPDSDDSSRHITTEVLNNGCNNDSRLYNQPMTPENGISDDPKNTYSRENDEEVTADDYGTFEGRRKLPRKQHLRSFGNGEPSPPQLQSPCETMTTIKPSEDTLVDAQCVAYPAGSCPYSQSSLLNTFDEATACHYSQELRAKLLKMPAEQPPDFIRSEVSDKWRLSSVNLNGKKELSVIVAKENIGCNEAVLEFVGKFKTLSAYTPGIKNSIGSGTDILPEPFTFFHEISSGGLCITIDCRHYGNAARFIRRSCFPNAIVRHVLGKGTIHAYVVTIKKVEENEEITIPHEKDAFALSRNYFVRGPALPCAKCSSPEDSTESEEVQEPSGEKELRRNSSIAQNESKDIAPKRRGSSRRVSAVEPEVDVKEENASNTEVKHEEDEAAPVLQPKLDDNSISTEEEGQSASAPQLSRSNRERTLRVRMSVGSSGDESSVAKVRNESIGKQRHRSGSSSLDSPSGLQPNIPGSNPGPSSAQLSREERKLQSVLKLIEKMENIHKKKEVRLKEKKDKETTKKDDVEPQLPPVKFQTAVKRKGGKRRGRIASGNKTPTKPQMITQRTASTGAEVRSASTESDVASSDEAKASMSPQRDGSSFRFPKTKKLLMTEWMNERVEHVFHNQGSTPVSEASPVPSQYIRKMSATPSPACVSVSQSAISPGSTSLSTPNLDSGSAKKRWLRQAIEEADTPPSVNSTPGSRPESPCTTSSSAEHIAPLKKRRLARASMSSEVSNTPPSTPTNAYYTDDADEKDTTAESPKSSEEASKQGSSLLQEKVEDEECAKDDSSEILSPEHLDDPEENLPAPAVEPEASVSEDTTSTVIHPSKKSRWDQVDTGAAASTTSLNTEPVVKEYSESLKSPTAAPEIAKAETSSDSEETSRAVIGDSLDQRMNNAETKSEAVVVKDPIQRFADKLLSKKKAETAVVADGTQIGPTVNGISSEATSPLTPVKKKLSILEYRKRQQEVKPDDTSNLTHENTLPSVSKVVQEITEIFSAKLLQDEVLKEEALSVSNGPSKPWSPTPTMAERKQEELRKRFSLGITRTSPVVPESPTAVHCSSPVVKLVAGDVDFGKSDGHKLVLKPGAVLQTPSPLDEVPTTAVTMNEQVNRDRSGRSNEYTNGYSKEDRNQSPYFSRRRPSASPHRSPRRSPPRRSPRTSPVRRSPRVSPVRKERAPSPFLQRSRRSSLSPPRSPGRRVSPYRRERAPSPFLHRSRRSSCSPQRRSPRRSPDGFRRSPRGSPVRRSPWGSPVRRSPPRRRSRSPPPYSNYRRHRRSRSPSSRSPPSQSHHNNRRSRFDRPQRGRPFTGNRNGNYRNSTPRAPHHYAGPNERKSHGVSYTSNGGSSSSNSTMIGGVPTSNLIPPPPPPSGSQPRPVFNNQFYHQRPYGP